jgi:hypothetical protein
LPKAPDNKGMDTKNPEPMMDASGVTMARQYVLPKTRGASKMPNMASPTTTNRPL